MGSYCLNRDSSPTQSQPASRKSQQMACDFCGLAAMLGFFMPKNQPRERSPIPVGPGEAI